MEQEDISSSDEVSSSEGSRKDRKRCMKQHLLKIKILDQPIEITHSHEDERHESRCSELEKAGCVGRGRAV